MASSKTVILDRKRVGLARVSLCTLNFLLGQATSLWRSTRVVIPSQVPPEAKPLLSPTLDPSTSILTGSLGITINTRVVLFWNFHNCTRRAFRANIDLGAHSLAVLTSRLKVAHTLVRKRRAASLSWKDKLSQH